jgi:phosphoglycolate phosphatase-like HAD superfamily hydrolase
MIKLIVFDLDDTITDNRYLDFESFNSTCIFLNITNSLTLKKLLMLRKNKKTAKNIVKLIKNSTSVDFSEDEFLEYRKKFLTSNKANTFLILKSGTLETLKMIHTKKIPICLCTVRKNKQIVVNFLKQQKIKKYFDTIFSTTDIDKKIDNTISENRILLKSSFLKKFLQKYQLESNEILYVGNSNEDFISASEHNIVFLKYDNAYLPKEQNNYSYFANNMERVNKIISKLIIEYD